MKLAHSIFERKEFQGKRSFLFDWQAVLSANSLNDAHGVAVPIPWAKIFIENAVLDGKHVTIILYDEASARADLVRGLYPQCEFVHVHPTFSYLPLGGRFIRAIREACDNDLCLVEETIVVWHRGAVGKAADIVGIDNIKWTGFFKSRHDFLFLGESGVVYIECFDGVLVDDDKIKYQYAPMWLKEMIELHRLNGWHESCQVCQRYMLEYLHSLLTEGRHMLSEHEIVIYKNEYCDLAEKLGVYIGHEIDM